MDKIWIKYQRIPYKLLPSEIKDNTCLDKKITSVDVRLSEKRYLDKTIDLEKKYISKGRIKPLRERLTIEYRLANSIFRKGKPWDAECSSNKFIVFEKEEYFNTIRLNLFKINNDERGERILESSKVCRELNPLNFSTIYSSNLIKVDTYINKGEFNNYFAPEIWIMSNNYKEDSNIYPSDIVIKQYEIASKSFGFYGLLPSVICRRNILNSYAQEITEKYGEIAPRIRNYNDKEKLLSLFLESKETGRSTKRIIDAIGMKAVDIDVTPYCIYLHISPIKP